MQILAEILTSAPSGRLYKALVETKKASSVKAMPMACTTRGRSRSWPRSTPRREVLDEVRDTILTVVEGVARRGHPRRSSGPGSSCGRTSTWRPQTRTVSPSS